MRADALRGVMSGNQVAVYLSATPTSSTEHTTGVSAEIGINTAVPEPGALVLLLTMLAPLGLLVRRKA
jgi:hypothetical protein